MQEKYLCGITNTILHVINGIIIKVEIKAVVIANWIVLWYTLLYRYIVDSIHH